MEDIVQREISFDPRWKGEVEQIGVASVQVLEHRSIGALVFDERYRMFLEDERPVWTGSDGAIGETMDIVENVALVHFCQGPDHRLLHVEINNEKEWHSLRA